MTNDQADRVRDLLATSGSEIVCLRFGYRPFDLPDGYITVSIEYADGRTIFGGISPEGEMST